MNLNAHHHQKIKSSVSRVIEGDNRSIHSGESLVSRPVLGDECSVQSPTLSHHAGAAQLDQEFQARNARAAWRNKLLDSICWCFAKKQGQRPKRNLQRLSSRSMSIDVDIEEGAAHSVRQYRLEAARRKPRRGLFGFLCCCCAFPTKGMSGIGISQNQSLAMYLHWSFRVNFFFLFIVSCVIFFALIILFAALLILVESADYSCVRISIGDSGSHSNGAIADAFALSWTTFSTVGYGSAYPSLSHQSESKTDCFVVTAICSLESFIGVLYSGFCGAILFGKVLRIQSHAEVMFSEPIVVKFGSGLEESLPEEEKTEAVDDLPKPKEKIPLPVLEFRIVNRLFNELGGEIMDATLNVVANVDANDASLPSGDSDRSRTYNVRSSVDSARYSSLSFSRRFSRGPTSTQGNGPIVSKRVFSKMTMESGEHPFFKRVWVARHVLDESSPILTHGARRAIRSNGGFWPESLNTAVGIRSSLNFNQILVSLNGISNVSASDVYAQKIYDFADLNVGYNFVNMLYRDGDGLKVDTVLINDVREQTGGGGEVLSEL